jgi:hypothetical protein
MFYMRSNLVSRNTDWGWGKTFRKSLQPWRLRQYDSPKRWNSHTNRHGAPEQQHRHLHRRENLRSFQSTVVCYCRYPGAVQFWTAPWTYQHGDTDEHQPRPATCLVMQISNAKWANKREPVHRKWAARRYSAQWRNARSSVVLTLPCYDRNIRTVFCIVRSRGRQTLRRAKLRSEQKSLHQQFLTTKTRN